MLEAGEEALNAPALAVGDAVAVVLVFATAAGRDDGLTALFEYEVVQVVGVTGAVGGPRSYGAVSGRLRSDLVLQRKTR